ncbi:MAG: phenylalanine--tRNA ligase subunit beta [Candidatus Omnitrophica bacterium]|nr:phenylalanine--tRNA ligase subunit beta [Candidatus Omnitrophota bacterium]MBU1524368.1 phenylalanine--tRNA ligase subunit beta [Candidatus Omnitrophota bacterium]
MRFSLNFIKEFLEVKVSAQKLASLLTMAGMEVERLEKLGGDWVFDIEVTSNRYDWLSILGIAQEAAACLNKKAKVKYPLLLKKPLLKERKIIIEDSKDCPLYIARVMRDITINRSPSWLGERVLNCGLNSINNIVDITNYSMLKWGNPLHAFDEDKIEGNIYIRRAQKEELFAGIDGKQRILQKENLVIADEKKVIALAGVMGGKNSEVDKNTKNVFIEAAIFSPLTIRRSARAAGLDTESSYRFQRRVSADCLEYACAEASNLIQDLGGGRLSGYKEAGRKPMPVRRKIAISLIQLNTFLGDNFSLGIVKSILSRLNFTVKNVSRDKIFVLVPCSRFDIKREVDIYEEFARIYGYEKIRPQIPFLVSQLRDTGYPQAGLYQFKNDLRNFLSFLGLREIITYSIEGGQDLTKLGERNAINILNPLREQENVLRSGLLLGMIKSIKYNLNRAKNNLRFFELANVYKVSEDGYQEKPCLSLAATGEGDNFFYLKGAMEEILRYLNTKAFQFKEASLTNFTHALEIIVNKKRVGFLGKLDEKIKKMFDLKENLFFAQLDVSFLMQSKEDKSYKPFSPYPVIFRDISIALRKDIKFKQIENIIRENTKGYLSGYYIVSTYQGKDLDENLTAFTLRISYQSKEKTLTSHEVDSLHGSIREKLNEAEGVILR